MSRNVLILVIVYEIISVVLIRQLWTRKHRPGVVERVVLSVVLIVPLLGWIFYGFLGTSPETHGEDVHHRYGDGGGYTGHHDGGGGHH